MKLWTLFLLILVEVLLPFLFILQHFHPWDSYRLKEFRRLQFFFRWCDVFRFMIQLIDVDLLWNSKLPLHIIINFLIWIILFMYLAFGRNLHITVALCVEFLVLVLLIKFDSCGNLKNTSWLIIVPFSVLLLVILLIFGVSFGLCNG